MFTAEFHNFDLDQIADSGQCFRMRRLADGDGEKRYSVISRGCYAEISQKGDMVILNCPDGNVASWLEYFDLNNDYQAYIDSITQKDAYLRKAALAGGGIRILKQDVWEMIITFIISQQKTIPKIKELVESLCRGYGTLIFADCHAFPTPCQLATASLEDLQDMKLGYRAKYIRQICQDACTGALDLDRLAQMNYQDAMGYLCRFYGIGEKVANCICLFGLHHIEAFPVDTWIQKILMREYYRKKYDKLPKTHLYESIVQDNFKRYKGYAGVMQQYIFYYERLVSERI